MFCAALHCTVSARVIFKMLNPHDTELLQLQHQAAHQRQFKVLAKLNRLPIFDLPFRSFFLLAVACSFISLIYWGLFLNGTINTNSNTLSLKGWHSHEMLFGFAATVAVGFILTASQTWTKQPSIKGLTVLALIVIWFAVRVCLFISITADKNSYQQIFLYIAVIAQFFWWLGAILAFSKQVFKSKNHRNYLFIPLLSTLMTANIGLLLSELFGTYMLSSHIAKTTVLLFCLLIGILAGRVIPFFTISGSKVTTIPQTKKLNLTIVTLSLLGIVIFFSSYFLQLTFSPAMLMISAGIAHTVRLCFWQSHATLRTPLLWSLHLSYFSLGLGLTFLGLSYITAANSVFYISFSDALHIITIAAMALMIFSMMSRVSLGHTGRKLQPHNSVKWLFIIVFLSAIARVFLPVLQLPMLAWNLSIALWLTASLIFFFVYMPVLITKNVS